MRVPDRLESLVECGIVQEVLRPLMSGKEAQVYLVTAGGKECVAKVYKGEQARNFKNRAEYTEGRRTRNTRDQRAMSKRSRHGRAKDEAAWQSTEVDMIHLLRAAGVRVPRPHEFMDGVLLMELVTDEDGDPAPRLGDVDLDEAAATAIYQTLLREVVRMLCAGAVHGDLSDFNVLMGKDGPVIIDLPQAVDPAKNPNARKLLVRDVDNLHRFLARFVPSAKRLPYAEEMWDLYQRNELTPDTPLRGHYQPSLEQANTGDVLDLIDDATWDENQRLESVGRHAPPAGARARRSGRRPPPRPGSGPAPRHDRGPQRSSGAGAQPHATRGAEQRQPDTRRGSDAPRVVRKFTVGRMELPSAQPAAPPTADGPATKDRRPRRRRRPSASR